MAGTLPTDTNNIVYEGLRDAVGDQFIAKQAGAVTTDAGGVKSAPQVVTFSDTTSSGSLAVDNAVVGMALPGGQATALFQITGTFVGTLSFQASADGGTTWVALTATSGSSVASSVTAPGDWRANIAGYTNVQVKLHPYTSGSATIRINLSAQPHTVSVSNAQPLGQQTMASSSSVTLASDQPDLAVKGDFLEVAGSGASVTGVNTDLIPQTDVLTPGYRWAVLQLSGTFSLTLAVQGSNDGVNWISNLPSYVNAADTSADRGTTITSVGLYSIPLYGFRYVRVRCTVFTSNTNLAGLIEFLTIPPFAPTMIQSATQSGAWTVGQNGTWTVQPGNTQNTTPWLTAGPTANATQAAGGAGTVIKGSAGYLRSVTVTAVGTVGLNIYDNASAASGTILLAIPANAPVGSIYAFPDGARAMNGIYSGGVANCPAVTIQYQ